MQTTANRFTHQSWFPPSYPSLPLRAVLARASQTLMNITNTIYSVTEGSKLRQEPTVLRKEQSLTGVTSPISRQGLVLRELTWADCSQTEELPIAHTRPCKKGLLCTAGGYFHCFEWKLYSGGTSYAFLQFLSYCYEVSQIGGRADSHPATTRRASVPEHTGSESHSLQKASHASY